MRRHLSDGWSLAARCAAIR